MTRLIGIPVADIDVIWPLVIESIDAACQRARGKFGAADIRAGLVSRDMQLWIAWDGQVEAIAVTEIVNHPRKTCCRVRICIGRAREEWQHHLGTIESWARAQGCQAMELIARPGWTRTLARHGYAKTHVFLEKELEHA